ncbi:MAG: TonB-dependent receptor [Burkholderiaceae bacterium]
MISFRRDTARPLISAVRFALVTLALAGPAAMSPVPARGAEPSTSTVQTFDLPAGPLSTMLTRIVAQVGLQLSASAELTAGRSAPAIHGRMTADQAFDRALAGSGLVAAIEGGTVVIRTRAASETSGSLPAVEVSASPLPADPPLGYLSRNTTTGALGDRSVLDTPFSISVVDSEEIIERGARSLGQVFANDAAVSTGTPSYTTDWWGTQIRGLLVRNYFIDGVPMLLSWGGDFPVEITENITALKGLSGFMYGFGQPGGAMSYQLKRPKAKDEALVYLGWRDPSLMSFHVDTSRKLADDLALRANLAIERGTTYNESRIERTVASVAVDKRFRGAVNWFTTLAYENHRNEGEPLFFSDLETYDADANGGRLPRPTYRYRNLRVDNAYYKTRTVLGATGVQWNIDDRWSLKLQVGASRKTHRANKAFATLLDRAGDYQGWAYNFATQLDTAFSQAVVQGTVSAGAVKHQIVAGLGLNRSRDRYSEFYYENDFDGNLYRPQPFLSTRTPDFSLAPVNADTRQMYAFVSDTVHLGDHWQIIAGLRYTDYRSENPGDPASVEYRTNKASPTLAVIYKPDDRTSFYGSYVEGLEPGMRVGPTYVNAGALLEAAVSRQYEIGAKHQDGRFGYAAALFRLERANQMDRLVGEDRYLTQDGRNVYQGVEASGAYQVDPALKLGISAVYLDATIDRVSADNASLKGKTPANAPKWLAAFNTQYRVPGLDSLKLHGNVQYFGAAWAAPENTLEVPGRTIVNAGFSYDFDIQGQNLTLIGNVYNLFNRKYWALTDWSRANIGEGRNFSLAILGRF